MNTVKQEGGKTPLTNSQRTKRLLADFVGRELLAGCSRKRGQSTQLIRIEISGMNVTEHRSRREAERDEQHEEEEKKRTEERGERRKESSRGQKGCATWARVERGRAHNRGKEHLAAGKSAAKSSLLRHQDLAPANQQRWLN